MYANEFAYHAPTSLGEVVALLQAAPEGEAKILAGGQSLLPIMKLRLAAPATLVDVGKVAELRGISEAGDRVVIGATTRYVDVLDSALVQRRCPLLIELLHLVGDPQVRSRGTVGGSLAHADPAGDLPAAALVLDAEVLATGPRGVRTIPIGSFFQDLLTTALEPTEVLTAVRFQATDTPRTGTAYEKHRHPASGYAVVGAAALVRLADDGTCKEVRLGITGAGGHAVRATAAEQTLVGKRVEPGAIARMMRVFTGARNGSSGKPIDDAAIAEASQHAADGIDLLSDNYASAEYRGHLTRVMAKRALTQALARANGQA